MTTAKPDKKIDIDAKKVIDADKQIVLQMFNAKGTEKILEYYKSTGKWEDVGIDRDGDIILWKNL